MTARRGILKALAGAAIAPAVPAAPAARAPAPLGEIGFNYYEGVSVSPTVFELAPETWRDGPIKVTLDSSGALRDLDLALQALRRIEPPAEEYAETLGRIEAGVAEALDAPDDPGEVSLPAASP